VHTFLFFQATETTAVQAMTRLGPYNTVTAGLLLAAGYTHGAVRWALWTAAFVLHWTTPAITEVGGFRIRAAHFVERHGLIVLIAIGESVVAVGIGLQGRRLTWGLSVTALLALTVAAGLWWLYFDGEDERAERALDDAPLSRNPWLALFAFGYAFLPLLGGIIVFAAGVKRGVVHYGSPAPWDTAWFLAAGVAVYVAALALLRSILRTGPLGLRLAIAGAALVTVVIGREASPAWQLAVLAAVLVAGIGAEAVGRALRP
jgi:low temperature requirement protein LtrA